MKLSFSTSGWNFTFAEMLNLATNLKFNGIEIHDAFSPYLDKEQPFSSRNIASTVRKLNQNGIAISCIDCVNNLSEVSNEKLNIGKIKELIVLAKQLSCNAVRLHAFCNNGEDDIEIVDKVIRRIITEVLPDAEKNGVCLLVETMGYYADTLKLKQLLCEFSSNNLCALWDIHHTVRYGKENPETTIKNLGAFVKHVHIKDSRIKNGNVYYCLMGEGDLPIKDLFNSLISINFDGYLSLELQPEWIIDYADADIVFPQFVAYMGSYMEVPSWQTRLYDNKSKTGKFIWEKESLIELTFPQVLDRVVSEFPDQIAFKYTTLDYTRTYSEFRDDVDNFARALIALGVKAGDKVALWATNVPEWYIVFWATTKIGAILVTMNTAYKIHETEYLLNQSDANTVVLIKGWKYSDYKGIIAELCPELATKKPNKPLHCKRLPFLRNVITVGFSMKGALTFEEALEYSKEVTVEEVNRRASLVNINDVCNMQYTSGTTGFPKGVMLTHYNVVNNGKCIGDRMDLSTADRMMIEVPMFHCFGMVLSMTAAMTHGATVCPLAYFSPKPALQCINQERITCFHGVPTMFIALLNHPDFAKTDFSYMRTGIMAGSPCPVSVMQDVLEKMNMKEITIVYGQTEASPGCTMSSTDDSIEVRVNTVGRPLPNIECKIVDPETNKEVPDNVVGEFVARGYNIMKGYYKMPKETAQTIDENGWLHTGDLALRTPDGNFKITGRLKDMIIRGGENIYPKELEEFIYTHPKVSDVQVIGVKDEQYGEEIYACVIPKENVALTSDEIKQYVRDNMAKHKVPRYVDIIEKFPMNAAGKILKYKMREDAEEKIKNGLIK